MNFTGDSDLEQEKRCKRCFQKMNLAITEHRRDFALGHNLLSGENKVQTKEIHM